MSNEQTMPREWDEASDALHDAADALGDAWDELAIAIGCRLEGRDNTDSRVVDAREHVRLLTETAQLAVERALTLTTAVA